MSKCRYDVSKDCNNTDCLNCVLDKIRAEIEDIYCGQYCENPLTAYAVKEMALEIIDKYKSEIEPQESEKV